MDGEVYETVGSLAGPSAVPDRCKNVIKELLDTEATYLNSLRDVLHGYQEPIRVQQHLPVKAEDVDTIFGNTFELHAFSKKLAKLFEVSQNDVFALASVFLDRESDFKIYTEYCTNHPRSIKTLTAAQQQPTAAEFFYGCQLALGHMLPLSAFLLKPVQRILKYHLLLADLLKQYGKAQGTANETYTALERAQLTMESVANYINVMMRKEEAMELISMVQGWTCDMDTGTLIMEGVFRAQGAKVKRKVYIFERLVLVTKRHKDNVNYLYKGHILHSQLTIVDTPPGIRDPLAFQLCSSDGKTPACILYAKDEKHKNKVLMQLRRLMLEHHPNLPEDIRLRMIESIEGGGSVVPMKEGEPHTTTTTVTKDKFQRQRVTKGKKLKEKNVCESQLEPAGTKHNDLSPACSTTSMDSANVSMMESEDGSGFDTTSENIYSSIYGGTSTEEVIRTYCDDLQDNLQFCPSDNESDHDDAPDGNKERLTAPTPPRCEAINDDVLDKPEVVVPISSDFRFSAPTRSSYDQRGSNVSMGASTNRTVVARANKSIAALSRVESSAFAPRLPKVTNRVEPCSLSVGKVSVLDKKQKEASMELTKGLVGRLVRKYTELTEDKPGEPAKTVAVGNLSSTHGMEGNAVVMTRSSGSTAATVPALTSPEQSPGWLKASCAVSQRVAVYNSKQSQVAPANRSSTGLKRSKSHAILSPATEECERHIKVQQRSASVVGIHLHTITFAVTNKEPEPVLRPSLYAVSAELRRDAYQITRKVNSKRTSLAYGAPLQTPAVKSGRVRDLIARFSVQPM